MPKQWVVNVASSIFGSEFTDWVKDRIEERNLKVTVEKDVNISIDLEIAAAFNQSTAVSRKYLILLILIKASFSYCSLLL